VTTPEPRPAPLVVAASLGLLEGLALLLLAAAELASLDPDRVSLAVSTAAFFALAGAGVLVCAVGLYRRHAWARGPMLLAQLITLGLAWSLRSLVPVALVLAVVAAVALAGMLHNDTMRTLGAVPTEDTE